MFNYRGQLSSAMTRSNTADNCNFMDNMFRMFFSTPTLLCTSSIFLLAGEQHWRNAL
ncbi:protein YdgV [Citrobacter tructae]|uniref:protein YdgV n=1 Tax=Citrobacter tructae TaxID=2562449 RepID=UPI003F554ECF